MQVHKQLPQAVVREVSVSELRARRHAEKFDADDGAFLGVLLGDSSEDNARARQNECVAFWGRSLLLLRDYEGDVEDLALTFTLSDAAFGTNREVCYVVDGMHACHPQLHRA